MIDLHRHIPMSISVEKLLGFKMGNLIYKDGGYRLPELVIIAPDYIKSREWQQGVSGTVGSIISWNYALGGKKQAAKESIEALDEKKKWITFNLLEGDLLKTYKSYKTQLHVDGTGDNSTVTWTVEYERMNENVPDPDSVIELLQKIIKYVETHLNPDLVVNI
ncbi:hypothetical protein L1987_79302 [Smallanthus sonchifolius]|uniref:Uncharacterized protein n=1 Tax=Smallanthus sonchifolius TaxID=185202 RepID=A0ACB8ZF27_9ASTR|nr:hypothetical protein L1987_79302 [Smallanthus sonchifolius]